MFTTAGLKAVDKSLAYYRRNLKLIRQTLTQLGWEYFGGVHAPYVWVRCPDGLSSWQCFDYLLETAGIVCTPGIGFGACGENYIRLTAFNSYEQTREACSRLLQLNKK